jgi:hypothetical protein
MYPTKRKQLVSYFGLTVEIVCEMDQCTIIRYNQRDFVVDTADLVVVRQKRRAA